MPRAVPLSGLYAATTITPPAPPAAPRKRKPASVISQRTRSGKRQRTSQRPSHEGGSIRHLVGSVTTKNLGDDSAERPFVTRSLRLSRATLRVLREHEETRRRLTKQLEDISALVAVEERQLDRDEAQKQDLQATESTVRRQRAGIDRLRTQMGVLGGVTDEQAIQVLDRPAPADYHTGEEEEEEEQGRGLVTPPLRLVRHLIDAHLADDEVPFVSDQSSLQDRLDLWNTLYKRYLSPESDDYDMSRRDYSNLSDLGRLYGCALEYDSSLRALVAAKIALAVTKTALAEFQPSQRPSPEQSLLSSPQERMARQQKRQKLQIDLQNEQLEYSFRQAETSSLRGFFLCALSVGLSDNSVVDSEFDLEGTRIELNSAISRHQSALDRYTHQQTDLQRDLGQVVEAAKKVTEDLFCKSFKTTTVPKTAHRELIAMAFSPTAEAFLARRPPTPPPATATATTTTTTTTTTTPAHYDCPICGESEQPLSALVFGSCGHGTCTQCAERLVRDARANEQEASCYLCRTKLVPTKASGEGADRYFHRIFVPMTSASE